MEVNRMYNSLANYYDLLVKDPVATEMWVEFVKTHGTGNRILEVACGSGEITNALAELGYQIIATDLSAEMVELAKRKFPNKEIEFQVMDMLNIELDQKVTMACCFCDSINYLNNLTEVERFIHQATTVLEKNGVLLFDMHAIERLEEFSEPFIEEGYLDEVAYQWTIQSEGNRLHHHFAFWQTPFVEEFHTQTVFSITDILKLLEKYQYQVKVFTDFNQEGIVAGERYCIAARKVG